MEKRRFDNNDDSVVVVIGSGAGGGTLANELAQSGVDVVCLEAGEHLDLADINNDEAQMFQRVTWLDRRAGSGDNHPAFPAWTCKTVGGTTLVWTGVCLRFQEHEMKPLSSYGQVSEAAFIDWPLKLADLEPYYDKAERKLGVTGTNGLPQLPANNNCKVMMAGARQLGYRDISTGPMAINSVEYDGRPSCLQIGFCTSGCVIGAKWSTLYSEVNAAGKTGHFELRPQSMAVRITHGRDARVTGVEYLDKDGVLKTQKAKVVCVAANAIETTRLLLNSSSESYPSGIGNGYDQVGRHYMRQFTNMVMSIMPGNVDFHRGAMVAGLIRDETRHDPTRGFVGGYVILPVPLSPENLALNTFPGLWGKGLASVMSQYRKFAGLLMIGEDPPDPDNRITLHRSDKDHLGLPVPVVHYKEHPNTKAMRQHAFKAGRAIHAAAGALQSFELPNIPAGHNLGACRMSRSPKTGVCNHWGRVFDIANLYVSDGSLFSSAAAETPTLTIVALAIRQAEKIAGDIKSGKL